MNQQVEKPKRTPKPPARVYNDRELDVIERAFTSAFDAGAAAKHAALLKKNAKAIKATKIQLRAAQAQVKKFETQLRALDGRDSNYNYHAYNYQKRDRAWDKLKFALVFATDRSDVERLIAEAVAEALR